MGIIRIGVDLIAKEAEYHKSCRVQFLRETDDRDNTTEENSSPTYHKRALTALLSYIQVEVIEKQRSMLISDLFSMYTEEYISDGRITKTFRTTQLRI